MNGLDVVESGIDDDDPLPRPHARPFGGQVGDVGVPPPVAPPPHRRGAETQQQREERHEVEQTSLGHQNRAIQLMTIQSSVPATGPVAPAAAAISNCLGCLRNLRTNATSNQAVMQVKPINEPTMSSGLV